MLVFRDGTVRIEGHPKLRRLPECLLQHRRICARHGKGSGLRRTRDVLRIQRFILDLRETSLLHGDQRRSTTNIRLVDWEIDPPLIALIDIREDELSFHVLPFVIGCGSLPDIDEAECLRPIGLKRGLIAAEQRPQSDTAIAAPPYELCLMKLPGVHTDLVLMDIPKADALHLLPQHLTGRRLRL